MDNREKEQNFACPLAYTWGAQPKTVQDCDHRCTCWSLIHNISFRPQAREGTDDRSGATDGSPTIK